MSHFSRVRTKMAEREFVTKALDDLGYTYEVGDLKIGGFGSARTPVEIKVSTGILKRSVGFRKSGDHYELVGDWYGLGKFGRKDFLNKLTQRYAYHAAKDKLAGQDFSMVSEEVDDKGRIHLVLRRMA